MILNLFNRIRGTAISFVLPTISTLVLLIVGFSSGKILSIELGVAGLSSYGIYVNLVSIIFIFANGGIGNGIISLIPTNEKEENIFFKKVMSISFFSSLFLSFFFFITSELLVVSHLQLSDLKWPVRFISIVLCFTAFNTTFISFLNAKSDLRKLTFYKVVQNIFILSTLFVLVFFLKSDGVFYALTLSQFLFFIFIFLFDKSLRSYIFSIDFKWFDSVMIKALLSFSAITLSTAIIAPVSQLLIRNALIDWAGVFSSGIWQSVLRVSEGYMLLFSTIILYVYMPTINSKKSNNELLKHLYEVFIPLALFVILIFVSLIILRQEIFILLYSKEFVKGADWIVYQIVGDFFKILSYSLIYVLIAKGRFKFFVLVELFFAAIEVGVSFVLIKNDFDNGPVMAHLFTMVLLFIFLVISRKKIINI